MRRYETIYILDPDLSEEQRKSVLDRVEDLITQYKGFLVEFEDWGSRKLAYEIKKKVRGFYVRLDYCGAGDLVGEMERFFRIDDRVSKYMTILLDENADLEAIKAEMAAKAEKEAQTRSEQPPDEGCAPPPETEPQSTRARQEEAEKWHTRRENRLHAKKESFIAAKSAVSVPTAPLRSITKTSKRSNTSPPNAARSYRAGFPGAAPNTSGR